MISKLKSFTLLVVLVLGISFSLEQQAHAYVDPGSGLLIFQSLSAIVTGGLFYFRRRLKALFTRSRTANSNPERQ